MTTVLLIGMLIWMVGVECRLWINTHRLNEHLETLHQTHEAVVRSKEKRSEPPFETRPLERLVS
jgi:hypothetical protein